MLFYAIIQKTVKHPEGGVLFTAGDVYRIEQLQKEMLEYGVTDIECTVLCPSQDLRELFRAVTKV